jgi:hypothetical protein
VPADTDDPGVIPNVDVDTENSATDTEALPSQSVEAGIAGEPVAAGVPHPEETPDRLVDTLITDEPPVSDELGTQTQLESMPETESVDMDFSELPLPDVEIPIARGSFEADLKSVTLREDSRPVIVDFLRPESLDVPMTLRIEEVGFSGNRSPWSAGQYSISNDGIVRFQAGQERARVILSMASDVLREADQQSTLRVRELDAAAVSLATIDVVLEDDDQRRFEAQLAPNTVGFAASQISVQERDPAVQIDLVRFNPDDTALVVEFEVFDLTAAAGEDYFPPSNSAIFFGPGQRAARVLIPLVQDSAFEGTEAFEADLLNVTASPQSDVHHRVTIMIRDDDGS